jgi:hypothetical protein
MATSVGTTRTLDILNMQIKQNNKLIARIIPAARSCGWQRDGEIPESEAEIVLVAITIVDQRRQKTSISLTKMTPGRSAPGSYRKTSCGEVWEQSREKRIPKTLFTLSRCRITKTTVLETCSPGFRCTGTIGLESWRWRRNSEQKQNPSCWFDTFFAWPVVCLYSPGNRPRETQSRVALWVDSV